MVTREVKKNEFIESFTKKMNDNELSYISALNKISESVYIKWCHLLDRRDPATVSFCYLHSIYKQMDRDMAALLAINDLIEEYRKLKPGSEHDGN